MSCHSKTTNLPEHVVSQLGEEWLFDKVLIVLLQKLFCGLLGLHGAQLVSLLFESADNVSDDTTLKEKGFCEIQDFCRRTSKSSMNAYLDTIGLDPVV